MITRALLALLLLATIIRPSFAQEAVLPLPYNPAKTKEALLQNRASLKLQTAPLQLPFWDDFSYTGPYPDPARWSDNYVFINNGYAVHPKTFNVASFDILDDEGNIYSHISNDNLPRPADHLTSNPIDLSSYSPEDSLVISFYYQPEGTGASPSDHDQLLLQFYLPEEVNEGEDEDDSDHWQTMWSATGPSLKSFAKDSFPYFKRVNLAITDSRYFTEGFRFRFMNTASFPQARSIPNFSSTANIWNIDYVYLDAGRSIHDSTYYDIAFASPAQSMLRDYTAIPWSHYVANPQGLLRNNFSVRISNLDNTSYNYTYRYVIRDEGDNTIRTYSGGSWAIAPFYEIGYQDYQPHSNPIVLTNPLPTAPATHRDFSIVHSLREGATGDAFPSNDTIIFRQRFHDYFSYDDGNPEMIHIIKGHYPSRAMQFVAQHQDIVEAVKIYFIESITRNDYQQGFRLKVWNSIDPEQLLYSSEESLIIEEDERGRFVKLYLDEEVAVEDTFYVGITQQGNVELRNSMVVGFDLDNDVSHRLFINTGDGWQPSTKSGALMIRPVMKRDYNTDLPRPEEKEAGLVVYPNPAGGNRLNIKLEGHVWHTGQVVMKVFDTGGRMVISGQYEQTLDISSLRNGIYLLVIENPVTGKRQSTRFIISR